MLRILHEITFAGEMTYLGSEMSVEVEIFTSVGTSLWWESGEDDTWPAYCIEGLDEKELEVLKQKIKDNSLTKKDIVGTPFDMFVTERNIDEICLGDYFNCLLKGRLDEYGSLYVFFDSEAKESMPIFFSSIQELANKMSEVYSDVNSYWEDMSDEELQYYVERYEDIDGFPMAYLENEE